MRLIGRHLVQAHRKPEGAADAGRAFDADGAAHPFGEAFGNHQPEAGAAVLARRRAVGLFKRAEQPAQRFGRDADAGILHFEAHQRVRFALVQRQGTQRHRAALGELDGVRRIVEQGLLQTHRIAAQRVRKRANLDLEFKPLVLGRLGDERGDVVHQAVDRHRCAFEKELAGFDLGQIENVVDDRQQMLAGGVDLVQPFALRRRNAAAAQQGGHAEDGVHRRANLVAHVGEKGALGDVGRFGGQLGLRQFRGARNHQFLKVIAVLCKLPLGAAARTDVADD